MPLDFFGGRGIYGNRADYPLPTHVLLDLKVPKVNGLEILEWLRHHDSFQRLPVMVFVLIGGTRRPGSRPASGGGRLFHEAVEGRAPARPS